MGDYSVGQVSNLLHSNSSKKSSSDNPALAAMFGSGKKQMNKKKHKVENGERGDFKGKKKMMKKQVILFILVFIFVVHAFEKLDNMHI